MFARLKQLFKRFFVKIGFFLASNRQFSTLSNLKHLVTNFFTSTSFSPASCFMRGAAHASEWRADYSFTNFKKFDKCAPSSGVMACATTRSENETMIMDLINDLQSKNCVKIRRILAGSGANTRAEAHNGFRLPRKLKQLLEYGNPSHSPYIEIYLHMGGCFRKEYNCLSSALR